MSDEIKFGLSDLAVSDDLDIALDNDSYQDQANPAPVPAGDYLMRILSLDAARFRNGDRKGQPILADNTYPLLEIGVVEIVEGLGDGVTRKVGLFQTVSTKPFDRDGKQASQLNDLARAYGLPNYSGFGELTKLLQEAVETRQTFGASLDWESGYDSEFVTAALEQFGLKGREKSTFSDDERKLFNAIQYRYAKVQGQKNFPYDAKRGRFNHVITRGDVTFKHPVTGQDVTVEVAPRTLEARNIIPVYFGDMKFIPKDRVEGGRVNFGPKAIKAPAAA